MSTDIAVTTGFIRLLNWLEANRQRVVTGAAAVAVVALAVSFYFWKHNQGEQEASEALSAIVSPNPAAYLKLVEEHPHSAVAPRAVLLAAGDLFAAGQYTDAQAQFNRLLQEYADSPFRPQAYYGLAACTDAQGKTADAVQAYKDLLQRYPSDPLTPHVRSALARLYEAQGKPELAIPIYQQQAREEANSSFGLEANVRLQALLAQNPQLTAKEQAVKDQIVDKLKQTTAK
jgi:TolA-binding protein